MATAADDVDFFLARRSTATSFSSRSSPSIASLRSSILSTSSASTGLTVPDGRKALLLARSKSFDSIPLSIESLPELLIADPLPSPPPRWRPEYRSMPLRELPEEIVNGIVEQLWKQHSQSNHRYLVEDLCSISRTNYCWHKAAKSRLYHTLWIPASNLEPQSKKLFSKPKNRLSLLRRTFRERPSLAQHVREIRVLGYEPFSDQINKNDAVAHGNVLASLITLCPKLERLVGFYPPYERKHDSFFQALSTRQKLKEHTWILQSSMKPKAEGKHFFRSYSFRSAPDLDISSSFVQLHSCFENLQTLSITCRPGGAPQGDMISVFTRLPALKQLHLSGFAGHDFENAHLLHLPRNLHSLRLESLPGVTENGLMQYFCKHMSLEHRKHLRSLSLVDLDIHSLLVMKAIMDHIFHLQRLVLVTDNLILSRKDEPKNVLQPFIFSEKLQSLHWDIGSRRSSSRSGSLSEGGSTKAEGSSINTETMVSNTFLAESILAGGFPNLESLCIPLDPAGIVQSVCKPLARPIVRAAAVGASPYFIPHYNPVSPPALPLIHQATSAQTVDLPDTDTPSVNSGSEENHSATAQAYHRAAEALHPRRRVGRDPEFGFRYDLLESQDPYVTICVQDPNGEIETLVEFPPFLGRLGPGVPEYVVERGGQSIDATKAEIELVSLDDMLDSGDRIGIDRMFW